MGRMHAIIQLTCGARDSGRSQTGQEKNALVCSNHFTTKSLGYNTNDNTNPIVAASLTRVYSWQRYRLLSEHWHPLPMARAYNSGRRPQWPSTVREVVENIEPVNGNAVGYPTPTVGGPSAPSCYRVSLLSGSLEVTARLEKHGRPGTAGEGVGSKQASLCQGRAIGDRAIDADPRGTRQRTVPVLSPRGRTTTLVAATSWLLVRLGPRILASTVQG